MFCNPKTLKPGDLIRIDTIIVGEYINPCNDINLYQAYFNSLGDFISTGKSAGHFSSRENLLVLEVGYVWGPCALDMKHFIYIKLLYNDRIVYHVVNMHDFEKSFVGQNKDDVYMEFTKIN
jgi:hypothetical protein